MVARLLQIFVNLVLWFMLLFVSAGTLAWTRGWLLLALTTLAMMANFVFVRRYNPGIAETRAKMKKGTKGWDFILMGFFGLLYLVFPVVAGLDIRFGWATMPPAAVVPGVLLFTLGSMLIAWALITNPYLETTVRIQSDRGHQVITSGPYRVVRHPMYCGMLLQYLSMPLILESIWSLAVSGAILAIFIIRTWKEDRTLKRELQGYEDFARRTRYRLLPGVW